MKQKLIIIKLGGSVITYKGSGLPKARIKVLHSLAFEIKQILNLGKYRLILVHGAGSFGHPLAKKYSLHKGMRTDEQKFGYSLTTTSMIRLNSLVCDVLHRQQVPTISLPPRSFIKQTAGQFPGFDVNFIQTFLNHNLVPILFGDGVLDDKWGCSILSGDTIVTYLAQQLQADKVIFLSDVDGIFETDPKKNPKAKLIPQITNHNLKEAFSFLSPTGHHDVTGEMVGKIMNIKKDLPRKVVYIISGFKKRNLIKAVKGEPVGTQLYFA